MSSGVSLQDECCAEGCKENCFASLDDTCTPLLLNNSYASNVSAIETIHSIMAFHSMRFVVGSSSKKPTLVSCMKPQSKEEG